MGMNPALKLPSRFRICASVAAANKHASAGLAYKDNSRVSASEKFRIDPLGPPKANFDIFFGLGSLFKYGRYCETLLGLVPHRPSLLSTGFSLQQSV